MKPYQDVFFDLDRTLWDFDANSKQALAQLYQEHLLNRHFSAFIVFYERYEEVNKRLWQNYYAGKIDRATLSYQRFYETLLEADYDNMEVAQQMAASYLSLQCQQTNLFPHAIEVLDYLVAKDYRLHIITNGFEEVQFTKLKNAGLRSYFQAVVSSERANAHKPDLAIFEFAFKQTKAAKETSIMIGDDLQTDIKGAHDFGIDAVFFNPSRKATEHQATFEIAELSELKTLL